MIAMQDAEAAVALEGRPAEEILAWASARFGQRITFATGFGAEGCVLIDLIARHHLPIDIFTLDTGLLFPETYALWRRLEQRYGVVIRAVRPEQTVDQQAAAHGDRLWARDPDRCCGLRKVAPLRAALAGYDAWISAIRRDQTPERASAGIVEADPIFGLVKVNPLASWTASDVSAHVRAHDVPVSPLHEQGYPSIGCVPCTSRVLPGEDPRAGRWRGRATSECGLHARPATQRFTLAPHQVRRTMSPEKLVSPHGGALVDRIATPSEADALRARAARLPALSLDPRELADLELIATGAASPLTGFLGSADYESVLGRLRLANDTVWPLPLTLAVADEPRTLLEPGSEAALFDSQGRLWGVVAVSEVFRRDPQRESRLVYGTEDPSHPGVAYLLSRPRWLVAGDVLVLPLPDDLPFAERRLTPRQLRDEIQARGWRHVAGFQTRNPIHRAHEHMTKLALEFADGLVIHPLVGETKNDDVPASVRFRAYEVLVDKYYPPGRTLLAAFPAAMRYAGPREALFHALVRKNYGIDRLIVGRDHAGVGEFYGPYEAQEIFDRFSQEELGVTPLKFEPTFFCRDCDALASPRTCPHDAASRLDLSGSKVRELLRNGRRLPEEFTRPEIAEILREHYAGRVVDPAPQRNGTGLIVWFTGLSGAGKSTLAEALRRSLAEGERPLEILDGDEVRTHLSAGLGFSREDRDTNVRRIGFVARLLARHGAAVATAAISPYAATRAEVRAQAEGEGIPFVEVYVEADLDCLVARDVKGLYRRALAGEIAHFTGVSDPYEPPEAPDVIVRSDRETVEESLGRILGALEERGLVAEPQLERRAS